MMGKKDDGEGRVGIAVSWRPPFIYQYMFHYLTSQISGSSIVSIDFIHRIGTQRFRGGGRQGTSFWVGMHMEWAGFFRVKG